MSAQPLDRHEALSPPDLAEMLRRMALIRSFDSLLPTLYTQGLVQGSSHAAIGQEAVAVGACAALAADDFITSTHRGHGHTIAKGGDPRRMMAELLGRADGYCHGKGGSMHIADFSIGMLGANGIVGGGFGLAGGAALSAQIRDSGQVAVCFFGDGAINQSSFHGVANMAAIWKLPLVLLCENNQFAMSARVSQMTAGESPASRAVAYGMPGSTLDGMDPLVVYDGVGEAVARARAGDGPSLVVADCYRFMGHFAGDNMRYRDVKETETWVARDPIELFRARLVADGTLSEEQAAAIGLAAEAEIAAALEFAKECPFPETSAAWEDVYA